IYTSGSSGTPKGVVNTHRNVVRLFDHACPSFDFRDSDVWTLFHSYAFDFSVWEIWGALLHGGKLVVVPRTAGRSAETLQALLAAEAVTVLSLTPAALYRWARVADDATAADDTVADHATATATAT